MQIETRFVGNGKYIELKICDGEIETGFLGEEEAKAMAIELLSVVDDLLRVGE